MFIGDLNNKDELHNIVVSELRGYGIKFRKNDKKQKISDKAGKKKIFKIPLHNLELTDCQLSESGSTQQIPLFVYESCTRILEHANTEGLFRKAGSNNRQKEIKASLEGGAKLNKSHHVIDVANLLKTFFRDLPEALLPAGNVQEALLRCLLVPDNKISALMMTLLLLPPLSLNTLSYFMQFLQKIAQHSDRNKMTKENIAIIIAPNIMPISEMIQQRLAGHVKVIELLIENAHKIGIIPDEMLNRLEDSLGSLKKLPQTSMLCTTDKKKKKRRSGSLTRMFNGIRKIVGAIGSSESLEKTPDIDRDLLVATPFLNKSAKKRKVESVNPFSAKKRKDVLSLLPENNSILPNTPRAPTKDIKKSRLSLGGRKTSKITQPLDPAPQAIERRWSVTWHRKKPQSKEEQTNLSPVVSMPCLTIPEKTTDQPFSGDFPLGESFVLDSTASTFTNEEEFVKIPKSEYEAIKERVFAIETRISHEFGTVQQSLLVADSSVEIESSQGAESVQNKYEQTLEKMDSNSNSATDHLAKRLSRELKIRRSTEQKVIRSPSARKIGTMRRRSRENTSRLSRNQSWHLGAKPIDVVIKPNLIPTDAAFYPKTATTATKNLRRGRPNTLQTGLSRYPSPVKSVKKPRTPLKDSPFSSQWTAAEDFFAGKSENDYNSVMDVDYEGTVPDSKPTTPRRISSRLSASKVPKTPHFLTTIQIGEAKTPMLPPNVPPRTRTPMTTKTPMLPPKTPGSGSREVFAQKPWLTPLQDNITGRASIAKLRSLNAGMVMAKAKLFNNMEQQAASGSSDERLSNSEKSAGVNRRQSSKYVACKSKNTQNNVKLKTFLESTNDSEMNGGDVRHLHKALRKIRESSSKGSPSRKSSVSPRKRYLDTKSPHSINRRQKLRMAKSPTSIRSSPATRKLVVLDDLDEENFIKSRKVLHQDSDLRQQPDDINRTPKIKKPLLVKVACAQRTTPGRNHHHQKTPLKATPIRHSPRLRKSGGESSSSTIIRPY